MSKVPGTFKNGDSDPKIPPAVGWDEDNPQTVFNCTNEIFHGAGCDEQCGSYPATEGLTLVLNEQRDWARVGINPDVNIDGLSMIIRMEMIEEHVREVQGVSEEDWDEQFRMRKAARMREMRESVQPQIEQAKMQSQLQIARSRIVGPHGEMLGG